ncbi:kappa-ctenitoxin-Pn1a [Parasteatoda tepidariorum]|uniref:kappa-ctenitoxin-Pn1a n=1 Tax=Parasteatoda tepidariorum TaxID=114398 RepID=UPI00077FB722|nr:kappa-ctenitoxin-Pn1a [Parasteatoda tepidariorum]
MIFHNKMNSFYLSVLTVFLVLETAKCFSAIEENLLENGLEKCAKAGESCRIGSRGHGPRHCCEPRICACNMIYGNCDCSWTAPSQLFKDASNYFWDKLGK